MRKENKVTKLRKSIDRTGQTVDALINALTNTRENAVQFVDQAKMELEEAKMDFEATKAGYKELQSRCTKMISFVNKLLN